MTASDKWEAWIAKVAAAIDRPTLVRAAGLRDERATWGGGEGGGDLHGALLHC